MDISDKIVTNEGLKAVIEAIRYNDMGVGFYIQSPNGNKFKLCVDDEGNLSTQLIEDSTGLLY